MYIFIYMCEFYVYTAMVMQIYIALNGDSFANLLLQLCEQLYMVFVNLPLCRVGEISCEWIIKVGGRY